MFRPTTEEERMAFRAEEEPRNFRGEQASEKVESEEGEGEGTYDTSKNDNEHSSEYYRVQRDAESMMMSRKERGER